MRIIARKDIVWAMCFAIVLAAAVLHLRVNADPYAAHKQALAAIPNGPVRIMPATSGPSKPEPLPADPFRRTATLALRGAYGPLKPWQREGYARGLALGVTCSKRVWTTCFYGTEGCGRRCRYGRCSMSTAAANRLPFGCYVWHPFTGLRRIEDRGSHANDARADRKGADLWVDVWYPRPSAAASGGFNSVETMAVIGEREER